MKFNQKLAKRFLAVALSFAMVVTSLFVLPTEASAASGVTVTDYTSVKAGGTAKFAIKGLKSTQYAKVAVKTTNNVGTVDGTVTAKYADKKVTSSTKIAGGKTRYIYVTNKNCVGETVTITVTVYNKSTNKKVDTVVEKVFVYKLTTSMSIKEADQTIKVGETFDFTGVKAPSNSTQKIKWTSSDTAVATVNGSGLVTGVAAGTATITATSGSKSASVVVTVEDAKTTISAVQTGAKEITITASKDISAEKIAVTRGNASVTATAEFSADGKTAVLTLAGTIIEAEYAITVGEAETTVNGEISKLDKIVIPSNNLILDGAVGTATTGHFAYVAYNQFDEVITSTVSTISGNSAYTVTPQPANGIAQVNFVNAVTAAMLGNSVPVTLYDTNTGKTVTATLVISSESVPYEIEVKGLYNEHNATLTSTVAANESFYYLFRVKDQYGNYMAHTDVTVGTTLISSFSAGITGLNLNALSTLKVDGVTYFSYPVDTTGPLAAGTATLVMIPVGSGKTITDTITVAQGGEVANITITAPSIVKAGTTGTYFDFTATDAAGNEVTSWKELSKLNAAGKMTVSGTGNTLQFVKVNGKVKLMFVDGAAPETANTYLTATVLTSAYKTSLVQFKISAAAYPAQIVGIKNPAGTDYIATGQLLGREFETITRDQFVIVDQYGDYIDLPAAYAIKVTGITNGTTNISAASGSAWVLVTSGDAFTMEANASVKGSTEVTFSIVNANDTPASIPTTGTPVAGSLTNASVYTVEFNSVKWADIKSYTVTGPSTIYAESKTVPGYQRGVTVYGIVSSTMKVKMNESLDDYNVTGGSYLAITGRVISSVYDRSDIFGFNVTSLTDAYVVTLPDGSEVVKEITISTAKPQMTSLYTYNEYNYGLQTINLYAVDLDVAHLCGQLIGFDSYGVRADMANKKFADNTGFTIRLTITDIDSDNGTVSNNGTTNPAFTGFVTGDTFTVTFTIGSVTTSATVTVQ